MRHLNLVAPREDDPPLPPVQEIREMLRAGRCLPDRDFDLHLPAELRTPSPHYWTPLEVCVRAAQWFDAEGVERVADIGSGPGKFCVATALASRASFVGLEHRPRLVAAASELARRFDVEDRVRFVHGAFSTQVTPEADAYYFYNPFGENLYVDDHLDGDVELSLDRHAREVESVFALLHRLPVGALLVTYNGYGGGVPHTYEQVRVDYELPNVLRMWKKRRAGSGFGPTCPSSPGGG